ncbi:MAG: hypothetical protein J07AB43_01770 [Candidatus Nanosalina sp. J07AB43]|jgi:hypothetical protein|nr:MAG: hypothetical protein J07AB43_01770 [Candidatus Nanosalina sp. J07AB43]
MAKDIVLKNVPEDQYWKWKRQKSDSGARNWVEFFKHLDDKANVVEGDIDGS